MPYDDATFARVAIELGILNLEDAVRGSVLAGQTGSRLRDVLVAEGSLPEAHAHTVEEAIPHRGTSAGLRGPRYEIGPMLGRGANGIVHLAGDVRLGRRVALKLHPRGAEISPIDLHRFTHEAQVTGQLAHPSVVPVHDLGILPDGRPYYAMKRIEGRTLGDVLLALRDGDEKTLDQWSIPHYISVLLRVAQALAFAHDRGVVHRDVKPANVMVGEYGEVLLLDWGVARVVGQAQSGHERVATWRSESDDDPTLDGTVAGTPAYMAPEQARGDIDQIGPASDVYSVGVMLYEYLAGQRPIRGKDVRDILKRVIEEEISPPSQRSPGALIPPELEAICMRCLAKLPEGRYPDGSTLASALEGYLEGSRRREEGRQLCRRGLMKAEAYTRAADAARQHEERLREAERTTAPWATGAEREQLLTEERSWREFRKLRDDTYDDAIAVLQSALERDPDQKDARTGLATLYLRRMDEADARGEGAATYFRGQVLRYDTGVLSRFLVGDAALSVQSDPPGADVSLRRISDVDGHWEVDQERPLGRTPVVAVALSPGTWMVEVRLAGHEEVTWSLRVTRPEVIQRRVQLVPLGTLAPGFAHVPGGPTFLGGDPLALDGLTRGVIDIAAFAIGVQPVTWGEFRRWLHEEGEAAGFEGWGGPSGPTDEERDRLPALGVTFHAAQAYAEWRSRLDGRKFRLPTGVEWEAAARGGDGRPFPWGDRWDATACNNSDATSDEPRPRPLGSSPRDRSIHGLTDLAGGAHEWVLDEVDFRTDRGWLRGGAWNAHPRHSRLCSRLAMPRASRGGTLGVRLVQSLE